MTGSSSVLTIWGLVLVIGLMTVLLRSSMIFLLEKVTLPALLERSLQFVPAAVLSALVIPAFILSDQQINLSLDNHRLMAGIIAATTAWRSRNILLTLCMGMGTLWLLQAFSS